MSIFSRSRSEVEFSPEELALLEESRRILSTDAAEASPADLQRVGQQLRMRRERAPRKSVGWSVGALGAGALAALLLMLLGPARAPEEGRTELVEGRAAIEGVVLSPGAALPSRSRLSIEPRARLRVNKARIVSGAPAELIVGPDPKHTELSLEHGYLAIAVEPLEADESFALSTPAALIEVIGTIFRVKVEPEGTLVEVEEGVVRVTPRTGAEQRVLRAKERTFVELKRSAPAASGGPAVPPPAPRSLEIKPNAAPPTAARPRIPVARAPAPSPAPVPAATAPPVPARSAPEALEPGAPALGVHSPVPVVPVVPRLTPVERARAALPVDAKEARAIAEAVLEENPSPEVEIEALMISADASRRGGDLAAALSFYLRVARHPKGELYAEEATLRAARIHAARDQHRAALSVLSEARRRFAAGPLLPERLALEAGLHRLAGELTAAAAVLDAAPGVGGSLPLAREQLAVGTALIERDRARAWRVLSALRAPELPLELRQAALEGLLRCAPDAATRRGLTLERAALEQKQ